MNQNLIKNSEGKWTIRFTESSDCIEIPDLLAQRIKVALEVPNQGDINCHKAILYFLGRMTVDELSSDAKSQKGSGKEFIFGSKSLEISDKEFVAIENVQKLKEFAEQSCEENFVYVGQVLDAETGELGHSFILGKTKGQKILCFDKAGFKYPFGVYTLETLFDFINKDGEKPYHNQKWRIIPLDLV